MKKFIFTISMILLMAGSAFGVKKPIRVNPKGGGHHSGQKAPANYSYLPTIIYDDEAETLSFEANADLGIIPYTITDENDNEVLSGTVSIYVSNTPTVSVSSLTPGDYAITIEVNDAGFEGEFTI